MPNILITGSNRGIGLELTRQYAQAGWRVFATCRHPAEADQLRQLSNQHPLITIHRVDVTVMEDIKAITLELKDTALDILFNNAGIFLEEDYRLPALGGIRYDHWLRTFDVNTLGAVRMTEALLGNVAMSNKRLIAVMTSHMGSIEDIDMEGSYYYRSSKAALNAAMQGLSAAVRPHQVGILLLHPGAVNTRMSPGGISPEKSVNGLRRIIDEFSFSDSGSFIKHDGTPMPW